MAYIEWLSKEEIEEISNRPIRPTDSERIEQLENMILQLLMMKGGDL